MSEWYESAFSKDYLALYPHRNDEEARQDVECILRLLNPPKHEPLLDLCCGAGRHLEALRDVGFGQLMGLDLSEDLLKEAKLRLQGAGASQIELHRADMRQIPFENRFATILSMFTSFGYFEDPQDDQRVLEGAYRALRAKGSFLMDTMNREAVLANLHPQEIRECEGSRLHIRRGLSANGKRIEKETRIVAAGRPDTIYCESVRMYKREELATLLEASGFFRIDVFGSLDGTPYHPLSPRMVFVARKQEPR